MTRRALTTISLLAALLSLAPARAAEPLPNVSIPVEAKKRLETYRKASAHTLKNILTPMVATTVKGEEFLGARWSAESGRIVALLKGFRRAGMIKDGNPQLKKWYDDEIAAWTNIQKIGYELLDLHYRMASNLGEIEQDIKHSEAYYTAFKAVAGMANEDAGRVKAEMKIVSEIVNKIGADAAKEAVAEAVKFGPAVDKISTALGHLTIHSQTVARLIRQFRKRQFEFIKDRGKLNDHSSALVKLKDKNIDPDQNGVFAGFEKGWEATMTKTFDDYEEALEEWHKVNRWHDGKEQLFSTIKSLISGLASPSVKFLTVGMPQFAPDNAAQLDAYVWAFRVGVIGALKKFRGARWGHLRKEIRKVEKERQKRRKDFQTKMAANDKEARKRTALAEEKHDKVTKPMKRECDRLAALLVRETDEETIKTLAEQMKGYNVKIESADRTLVKMQRFHMETWVAQQEDIAFKEFKAAIEILNDRLDDLNKTLRLLY